MKTKLLKERDPKTFAVVFDTGDEVAAGLARFAKENRLSAAAITAIGAFQDVTLGYFDWQKKDYNKIRVREQVEVLSLIGDIALDKGEPKVHVHVVIGKADGTAHGGHLLEAHVRPTLEVIITETPGHLRKRYDPETQLALIDLNEGA
jgi:predicted DNA-binding protein with PD1-like motif